MQIKLLIADDGVMEWENQVKLPSKVFDLLEDAMACFPAGTKMCIEYQSDAFCTFDLGENL